MKPGFYTYNPESKLSRVPIKGDTVSLILADGSELFVRLDEGGIEVRTAEGLLVVFPNVANSVNVKCLRIW